MLCFDRRGQAATLSVIFLVLLFLGGPAIVSGGAAAEETIRVVDAKARPTLPNAGSGVVYLTIVNQGTADDALTSVIASVAASATVHLTENDSGVMTMKPVDSLPVKAAGTVRFAPNGLHIMLTGLKRQLKTGDSFPITLNFATAGPITAAVAVGPITPALPGKSSSPDKKL